MSAIAAFRLRPGSRTRSAECVALVALALWVADSYAAESAHRAPQQDAIAVAAADAANFPRAAIEVSSSTLPRFDNVGGATRSSRVDITLLPQRSSGVGLALGVNSVSGASGAFLSNPAALPWLDLGVHWRYTLDSNYRFDVTAYRRVQNSDAISLIESSREPSYGARVEMGLASDSMRKGFVADHGFIGFQLESGARLTVKRSGGVPMLYYRNQF